MKRLALQKIGVAWAFLLPLFSFLASAQTSASSGRIDGWVYDSSGQALSAVRILAINEQNGAVRAAVTDSQGYFQIPSLAVGVYTVRDTLGGFTPFEHKDIEVGLGGTMRVDARLVLATQMQQITVTGKASLINPSDTSVTSSVGRERIEESPVQTRNALDFVLLEPGVIPTSTQPAAGGSRGLVTSGFSFGGMRPTSNRIAIDGVENDDELSGGSRTELSPEIVQEFQVVNNGMSAEFGGAAGGAVNVVTRSGANTMHGDAFIFLQNGALNARPPFEDAPGTPDLSRFRAGLSNGGALVQNRAFYYVAAEQEHQRSQTASDIQTNTIAQVNLVLSSELYRRDPVRRLSAGYYPTSHAETETSAKVDQQWSERNSTSLRYAFTNNREAGEAFNTGGLLDTSSRGSRFLSDQSLAASWTLTPGPNSSNNMRAQVSRRSALLRTNTATGPQFTISGVATFGQTYDGNQTYREDHADIADTYSWSHGPHLVQVGGAVTYIHENVVNPQGEGGSFVFSSLMDFKTGQPSMYRQMFGDPHASFSAPSSGEFVQDHWVVTSHLTIDAGLRYDFETLPKGFHRDAQDFSPRAGLAFSLTKRLVIRAGYGIFFDRYVLASLDRSIIGNGMHGFEQIAGASQAMSILQQTHGASLPSPTLGVLPSIYLPDPQLATPYSQQANFGVQYALAKEMSASANYLFVRGSKLARTRNVNLLPPSSASSQQPFSSGRLNALYDSIYQLEDSASSTYNGLSLAYRVMKQDFTLDTSYTFSKALDDGSSWSEQPQNPYNLRAERGLSAFDVRHRVVLSGLFDVPIGDDEGVKAHPQHSVLVRMLSNIELAPIVTVASGMPVNPLTGADSNNSRAYPLAARPLDFGRNTLQTPPLAEVDLRFLKAIPAGEGRHLDLVAEAFNLFNHINVTAINPVFGSSTIANTAFRAPIDAMPGRQLEFSLDFEF